MPRKTSMLGKRRYGTRRRNPRNKRKYRSGNQRTGGLYRLRGQRSLLAKKNVELKFFDKYVISSAPTAANADSNQTCFIRLHDGSVAHPSGTRIPTGVIAGSWSLVNYMSASADPWGRIGRKVVLKSIEFKLAVHMDGDDDYVQMKMWLVQDLQSNGTPMSPADIWNKPLGTAFTNPAANSWERCTSALPSVANKSRFRILKEITWAVNADLMNQKRVKIIEFYKRLNMPIEYGGTTGADTEIKSNNLAIFFAASKENGTYEGNDPFFSVAGQYRIRYLDI